MACASNLRRQKESLSDHLRWFAHLSDKFQVADAVSDRDTKLVSVDQPIEWLAQPMALACLSEQVVILSEQHSLQFSCTIQQSRILKLVCSILVGRKYVHSAQP